MGKLFFRFFGQAWGADEWLGYPIVHLNYPEPNTRDSKGEKEAKKMVDKKMDLVVKTIQHPICNATSTPYPPGLAFAYNATASSDRCRGLLLGTEPKNIIFLIFRF